jgi:hypothetical protein
MFRAFLIAIGISMCIVGGECLVVDQAVVTYRNRSKKNAVKATDDAPSPFWQHSSVSPEPISGVVRREIKPPEWAPWSLLSGGVVVALYALTVHRE